MKLKLTSLETLVLNWILKKELVAFRHPPFSGNDFSIITSKINTILEKLELEEKKVKKT